MAVEGWSQRGRDNLQYLQSIDDRLSMCSSLAGWLRGGGGRGRGEWGRGLGIEGLSNILPQVRERGEQTLLEMLAKGDQSRFRPCSLTAHSLGHTHHAEGER